MRDQAVGVGQRRRPSDHDLCGCSSPAASVGVRDAERRYRPRRAPRRGRRRGVEVGADRRPGRVLGHAGAGDLQRPRAGWWRGWRPSPSAAAATSRRVASAAMLVGRDQVGDVLGGAAHPDRRCRRRPARSPHGRGSSAPRPSGRTIRWSKEYSSPSRVHDRGVARSPVLGVDRREVGRVGDHGARLDPEDPAHLVGPLDPVRRRRPTPSCRCARSAVRWRAGARAR